ncbi:UNVERIFIED_CONTAM: hypothetical protein Slati_3427200 [Sesamum latifolium]|uniref:Reverse transcriptase zinc-binding domain-containing protein n=1 Tax=Sesamum latifolium TaxID=2727402 RepID=A0AAW2UHA1_9LAMI
MDVTMSSVTRKLKLLKPVFRKLRKAKGDLASNVKQAVTFLARIQQLLMGNRNCTLFAGTGEMLSFVYSKVVAHEQLMLKQRAKLKWLKEGDVRHTISDIEAASLTQNITDQEVKEAVFDIADDKSPGPDGFSFGFFKDAWSMVGTEILSRYERTETRGPSLSLFICPYHGKINSVQVLQEALVEFSSLSGLKANPAKSPILLSKYAVSVQQQIEQLLGFTTGSLPIKYLGLPLISSRLTLAQCQPLLLKIDNRMAAWRSSRLSFAGRVQIIKSILGTLHNYWSSSFILPKGITKCIGSKLRSFLWKGCDSQGYAKVHWEQDPWLKGEILIQKYPRGPMLTSLSCDAKLQDVILDGKLTLSAAYSLFSPDGDKVFWACLFQSPFKIARTHFILWLAILGSLSTADKSWLHIPLVTCCLCDDEALETNNHIFCQCPFISQCLRILKREIRLTWLGSTWQQRVIWASKKWRRRQLMKAVDRATIAALIYHVWMERNKRRFQGSSTSPEAVARQTLEVVRCRILSENLPTSLQTSVLYRIWKIAWN